MKGNDKVLSALQDALTSELTAVNQYVLHAAMLDNWNLSHRAEYELKVARKEMKHVDAILDRILFLEARPKMDKPLELKIAYAPQAIIENDLAQEKKAISDYNKFIKVAVEAGDNGSRDLFEDHLETEEKHANFLEGELAQIKFMGFENWLAEQIRED